MRPLSINDRGANGENSSDSPNGSRQWRPALRDENGDTPASCRRGERGNLAAARNYGSAAEELEQLGRFGAHDILRTFGKPLPVEDEANLNRRERMMNRQELLDGLDRLSIDTIERLKERNHNLPGQSFPFIAFLTFDCDKLHEIK